EEGPPPDIVQLDRSVARGVHSARDAQLDLAQRDLVGHVDGRLEPRPAGLLHLVGRRVRRQRASEDALASEVEVAASLEDPAGRDLAYALPLEPEAADEPVERRREHVLVGRPRILAVAPREGNPVSAQDGDRPAVGRAHASASSPTRSRITATFGIPSPISAIPERLAPPHG